MKAMEDGAAGMRAEPRGGPGSKHSSVSATSALEVYILLPRPSTTTPFLRPPKAFSCQLDQSPVDHPANCMRACSVLEEMRAYRDQTAV